MQLTTPIPPSRISYHLSGSVKWIPPAKGDLESCPIKSLHLFFTFCLLSFFYSTCSPPRTQEIEKPVPAEPVVSKFYLWVIKAQVNVRDKNSEKAAVITQLTEGDSVLVFENRNGWYRIRTNENRAGWIRTDLLGPRHLSIFLRAVSFSDSLRDQEGIDLYFDKKLQHKRIYLSLPVFYYSSREKAETKAREIIENFQKSVYNGEVTLRVLKPDSRDEFLSISETGQSNPEPVLPVLPFGILKEVRVKSSREISLLIMIPDGTGDTDLLLAARSMAAAYPLSFTRVEIQFNDNRNQCRMWFQEGQDGERYRFHPCKS